MRCHLTLSVLDFKKLTEQELDVNVLTQQSESLDVFTGEGVNSANQMISWAGVLFSTGGKQLFRLHLIHPSQRQ